MLKSQFPLEPDRQLKNEDSQRPHSSHERIHPV